MKLLINIDTETLKLWRNPEIYNNNVTQGTVNQELKDGVNFTAITSKGKTI